MTDPEDEGQDPYLEAVIDDAMGPLAALLPARERASLRDALRDVVKDDPALAELYAAARPRQVPQSSGEEEAKPGTDQASAAVPARRKGGAA